VEGAVISPSVRAQIKGYLEGFLEALVTELGTLSTTRTVYRGYRSSSRKGDIKPFHEALVPEGVLRVQEFERSLSTRLGTTFEECARLIGSARYAECRRQYLLSGQVSAAAVSTIDSIKSEITSRGMQARYQSFVNAVASAYPGDMVPRRVKVDLYLRDHDGDEWFFEMRSPKPNDSQCVRATEKMLQIHAIRRAGPPKVRTYWAMAYNPYGDDKSAYGWSFGVRYLDMQSQVLVGREFWDDVIGGPGTLDELLEIYAEVGHQKGPDVIERLILP